LEAQHYGALQMYYYYTELHGITSNLTQANTPSIYLPGGKEVWGDLGGWLHTETVYLSTDSHPSK